MVTALWAIVGALLGLIGVLLLMWCNPAKREPDEVGKALLDLWRELNHLHTEEVAALQTIADAAKAWQGRYQRRAKKGESDA